MRYVTFLGILLIIGLVLVYIDYKHTMQDRRHQMNQDQRKLTEQSTIFQIEQICKGYNGYNYEQIMMALRARINLSEDMLNEKD